MGGIVMKCEELQIGDWIQNKNGDPMQIIKVGKGFVHTNIIDDDGFSYVFCDEYNQPEGIPLTKETLEKNGWKETQYWHEYQDGKNTIQCCLPELRGKINGIEVEHFRCEYVHQYQHLLRLCGLDELADNFKV